MRRNTKISGGINSNQNSNRSVNTLIPIVTLSASTETHGESFTQNTLKVSSDIQSTYDTNKTMTFSHLYSELCGMKTKNKYIKSSSDPNNAITIVNESKTKTFQDLVNDIINNLPDNNGYSITDLVKAIYPIGTIIFTITDVNPSVTMPGTTWVKLENINKFIFASTNGAGNTVNSTLNHRHAVNTGDALTEQNIPIHNHMFTLEISNIKYTTKEANHNHTLAKGNNSSSSSNYRIEGTNDSDEISGNYYTSNSGDHVHDITCVIANNAEGSTTHNHSYTNYVELPEPPFYSVCCWERTA